MTLAGIGPPGLALFLGQETMGLCLGYVVLQKPKEGYDYQPRLSQFPQYLSKLLFTEIKPLVFIVGGGLNFWSNEPCLCLIRCLVYN